MTRLLDTRSHARPSRSSTRLEHEDSSRNANSSQRADSSRSASTSLREASSRRHETHAAARTLSRARHTAARIGALLALCIAVSCFALSCGSAGSSRSNANGGAAANGLALRVTWRDMRVGTKLELVSQTHTDALALYSKQSKSADTKVQSDAAMDALLDEFERKGFDKHAQAGKAPPSIAGQVLEVESPAGTRYLASLKGMPADARKSYLDCFVVFQQLYNYTDGLQNTQNPSGAGLFDEQKQKLGSKH